MKVFRMVIAAILFLTIQKSDQSFLARLDHFMQKKNVLMTLLSKLV
jgi:hypothetical protein